ncbi:MAG TPA: tripartite tricarboxylate transporter substrate binding protein [Bradyrhizobium sp.]|uniref:Bug family tripartite tricarboxylate transporter substrate binding protein n=1 Tax=Bradyrhizobium sp. TaxID=376 RepID=UPI002D7E7B9B|nr:tripartite tricarboxylate transporter substrate binding protein [Bradyrhizobium sp.]HET7886050.1 tripartite tricarboxylate transporter substrate binding protein [Bradyrhizobium sp.]
MTVRRRDVLQFIGATTAAALFADQGRAQAYPTRPVRWVVGYPAGGASDIFARTMGQWLSEQLGQPFVIENRSGASGNIATEAVARASPDGYTLLLVNAGNAINATLYKHLNFAFPGDFTAVGSIVRVPLIMLVNPLTPVRSIPEFIAYAKEHRGTLNMASAGNGTPQHLAGELFKMMTKTEMTHVPYRGSAPALTDLLSGQVHVAFDTTAAAMEQVKAGKLRALAITTKARSPALPDIPAITDYVPGYEASGWYGVSAPRGTPGAIVERLNRLINAGLADGRIADRFLELGATPFSVSASEFEIFVRDEIAKWAKVIEYAGTRAE